jgi:hypothetical protein
MAFDWIEYLDLARLICEQRTNCDYDDELRPNVNANYAICESQRVINDVTERLQMESKR